LTYAKWVKKGDEVYGPYFYKTIRGRDGKVTTVYLGSEPPRPEAEPDPCAVTPEREITPTQISAVTLVILFVLLFGYLNYTGYLTAIHTLHTQTPNIIFTGSQNYTLEMEVPGNLSSLSISGAIVGNGSVRVYLLKPDQTLLVLDSDGPKGPILPETNFSITGLLVEESPENLSEPTSEPQPLPEETLPESLAGEPQKTLQESIEPPSEPIIDQEPEPPPEPPIEPEEQPDNKTEPIPEPIPPETTTENITKETPPEKPSPDNITEEPPENLTLPEQPEEKIPSPENITEAPENITNVTTQVNETNVTIPEENITINITPPINVTINITPPEENLTINITPPINETNITEPLPEPENVTIRPILEFENICLETCSLDPSFTENLTLFIEIDNGTDLHLNSLTYGLVEYPTPENLPPEGEVPNQTMETTSALILVKSEQK
jgi:hypothetical protein